jgi:hypothetical protein
MKYAKFWVKDTWHGLWHWPLYHLLSSGPIWDRINRRWTGTTGTLLFGVCGWLGHDLDIWDQAIGCNRCGWNDW